MKCPMSNYDPDNHATPTTTRTMNRHLLRLTLLLTARLLCAIETPTVDLYAVRNGVVV